MTLRLITIFFVGLVASLSDAVHAQSADTDLNDRSWLTKKRLLDSNGREALAQRGIAFNASLTQFYQGSPSGDGSGEWQYGGKGDVVITFDGKKLGLWPGLHVSVHGEALYGEDANKLGNEVLLPANSALALPRLGGRDQDISVVVTQNFSERLSLSFGKFNMLDILAQTPLLGGGGTETFMNLALAAPITGVTPPYLVGASTTIKTEAVILTAFVYDPRNAQNEEVLRNPFSEGVTGMLSATVPYRLAGRSGFLGAKVIYSDKEGTDLADVPQLVLPEGSAAFVGTKTGSWFLGASFQQYLVQNPDNPEEGWGLFGQVGFSDGNPNPIEWSAFVGLGGTSFITGRHLDRWGVAYFRYALSSDLREGIQTLGIDLRDEQGLEAFYSFALTPWLSLTGDVQVVQPVVSDAATATTASLRTKIRF
jgi:porin